MHAMGAPHVGAEPVQVGQVLDGRAAVELHAVRLLLHGLGEVRVERQAELAGKRRRLGHELLRDRERRARRHRDLDARAGPLLVQLGDEALGVRQHRVDVLDQLVGREPAVGLTEIHRAARGDDPHAELARRLHLRLDQARAAAREDVVVVEDGRAAGERELGEARAGGGVLGLRVDPRPDRIELAEPCEEVGLLRAGSREGLVEVVMRVDEAGRDDRAAQVDALVGLGLGSLAD